MEFLKKLFIVIGILSKEKHINLRDKNIISDEIIKNKQVYFL